MQDLTATTSPATSGQFEQFSYVRPDWDLYVEKFDQLLLEFKDAGSAESQAAALKNIDQHFNEFLSMRDLASVRHTLDTTDAFYDTENQYFDEQIPLFEALEHQYYQELLNARFRPALEMKYGQHLFSIATLARKVFSPSIVEDLQEDNRLSSEYVKIKAQAQIPFHGKDYNLSSLAVFAQDPDRTVRKEAIVAKADFYQKHEKQFDRIFDDMVSVRSAMANKLGYQNFVQLAYDRRMRTGYGPVQVAQFRNLVKSYVTPLAGRLFEQQRKRLQLDALNFYDESYVFPSGNPNPKGNPEWIQEHGKTMYEALSIETGSWYKHMQEAHLMDLVNRPGKATGGYCTFIPAFEAPFIFSNFNGTADDITVLTHEAGHAFQVWSSRKIGLREYFWPTTEACEIHSMSMEFFTWPWMHLFFEEDTPKFQYQHLSNALQFLPYGVLVDHFQEEVYLHPEMTPEERKIKWRSLERAYLPHRNYEGVPFFESGTYWYQQTHIFSYPFYYIDYCLAQICAFQFWLKATKDHATAWKDYLRLCQAGGSAPFLELVQLAGLDSPFDEDVFKRVVQQCGDWLDRTDDAKF